MKKILQFWVVVAVVTAAFWGGMDYLSNNVTHRGLLYRGLPHRPQQQSWDQETLKQRDTGCPTAVFVAPGGNLIQCQKIVKAPSKTDPAAPPVPPDVEALISRFIAVHSTSEWFRFKTIREAAIYAGNRAETCSYHYECSGVISIDPKGFFAVGPVRTDYQSDSVRIVLSDAPSDWTIAATFHTHPCLPNHANHLFSPQDIMGSISRRLINYMIDLCTGDVHEFVPGKSKPDTVFYDGIWMTGGAVVGHVPPAKMLPANEGL